VGQHPEISRFRGKPEPITLRSRRGHQPAPRQPPASRSPRRAPARGSGRSVLPGPGSFCSCQIRGGVWVFFAVCGLTFNCFFKNTRFQAVGERAFTAHRSFVARVRAKCFALRPGSGSLHRTLPDRRCRRRQRAARSQRDPSAVPAAGRVQEPPRISPPKLRVRNQPAEPTTRADVASRPCRRAAECRFAPVPGEARVPLASEHGHRNAR